MKRFFDGTTAGDDGSPVMDWAVLLTGIVLLAFSVIPAITVKADQISASTLDRVVAEEDWLPS
ncbi:MAG: hypothetical protein KDK53_04550 [Maritimibacter sp.]|nr:hypothetical protein [Maritimibacter sp.]